MRRPIIGITTSLDDKECKINHAYMKAVAKAGGLPMLLPALDNENICDEYINEIDGILLSGGTDILPAYFGEFMQEGYNMPYELSPRRDHFEIKLYNKADIKGLPMLGICRGIQVMAVAGGGSIFQDIDIGMARQIRLRHSPNAPADTLSHPVLIKDGTRLGQIINRRMVWVNSMHHQGVKLLPKGYRICATAPDGVIEGIELESASRFAVGVQWHPERLLESAEGSWNLRLFEEFVRAASLYNRAENGKIKWKEVR